MTQKCEVLCCVQVPHSVKSHLMQSRHTNSTDWRGGSRPVYAHSVQLYKNEDSGYKLPTPLYTGWGHAVISAWQALCLSPVLPRLHRRCVDTPHTGLNLLVQHWTLSLHVHSSWSLESVQGGGGECILHPCSVLDLTREPVMSPH